MSAIVLILVCSLSGAAFAADDFDRARELAFAGERDEARELLNELLEERPEHWDARILLGRIHAWDGRYEQAREHLRVVVRAKPDYADARVALADVELWSGRYEEALVVLEEGLHRQPVRQEFLLRTARVQGKLGHQKQASVTLDRLLEINPSHSEGQKMFRNLRLENSRYKFGVSYDYTSLDDLDAPWHEASFQLSRRTGIGSVIGRVNYANRFEQSTAQYEIDAYPKLADGLYVYLNYGHSPYRLYPRHRYGGEVFASLPGSFEVSAGFRRLLFDSSDVTVYTGTLAKYQGNWWIALRPYVTPKDDGTSRSLQLSARRYLSNADTWLQLTVGAGSSPGEVEDTTDLLREDSRKIGLRSQSLLGDWFILKLEAGYEWEELTVGRERRSLTFGFGFERRF